jgi:FkbM family methyltransferase
MIPERFLPGKLDPANYPSLYPLRLYYFLMLFEPEPEPGDVEFYNRYVHSEDVVLDIGAKWGGGTVILSRLSKFVYSFEPNPIYFKILHAVTRKLKNVRTFNVGLGSRKCDALMRTTVILDKTCDHFSNSTLRRYRVKLMPLDELSVSFNIIPTVIVMDCEGYELEVLKGAKSVLGSASLRMMLIETHEQKSGTSTKNQVISLATEHSFKTNDIKDKDQLSWILAQR